MKLAVYCDTCRVEVVSAEATALSADTLMMLAHITAPHSGSHVLRLLVDGQRLDALAGERHVHIRCISPTCQQPAHEREKTRDVPTWLVGAYVNAFHARHEGHAYALEVDGVTYF